MNDQLPPALFLMGPTASGKTALAMEMCQKMGCEIISVDSALIYRGMDIGTAKPSAEELQLAPHRLIDIKDPADSYSAADFRHDALEQMANITAQGKVPLLVGGTMMYFKVLLEGISSLPAANPVIRQEIEQQAAELGWQALHQALADVDPEAAQRIHPNDPQRLMRALEVYKITGNSISYLTKRKSAPLPYRVVQLAISPQDRSVLHERIEQRFDQMLAQGFEQEVRQLYQRGDLHLNLPSIRAVGYRQMWEYFLGHYDYDEMRNRAIAATRQLAKRQLTWLRGWPQVQWLDTFASNNLEQVQAIQHDLM